MNNNYVAYHLHSCDGSLLDSATKFGAYVDKAKELKMRSMAYSEHGNIFHWIAKKQLLEKNNIKYIHAQEFYVTETLNEKIRDNYHVILIAKNLDGVKYLNKLSSIAFTRSDNHFYYKPRISFEELINTSKDIIVCTACLGGILWKGIQKKSPIVEPFIEFLTKNKHRCFLEIQSHSCPEQHDYNLYLYELSKLHSIPLIAGGDFHSVDEEHAQARKLLMIAKNITFKKKKGQKEDIIIEEGSEDNNEPENEDMIELDFDLTFKSYDEFVESFKVQNCLPEDVYLQAIENTNIMSNMVEEFKLDYSHKYPKMYDTQEESEQKFKELIEKGMKWRGFHKFPKELRKIYYKRINTEFKAFKKTGTIEYMLFQEDITTWARNNDILIGYGRGSVTGSLIAYTLGITEMDSVKHKLIFTRFINPDRVSLADIDIDFPPSRRDEVIAYIASRHNINFSEIITFNTVQMKGSIREVGRALKIDFIIIDEISKNIETREEEFREKYPELFKYVDLLIGVNVSVGSHPSGFLTSPITLEDNIGTFYTSESKYPVSQCNMKEVDSLNYVKLDCLGLDNIEIINETCRSVGIPRLTPDNMDIEDDAVWDNMKESGLGIFQFGEKYAHDILTKVLNAINIIRQKNPKVSRIDLMSMTNGAIRPSGASYRDMLCEGKFKDNGHPELNNFLMDTQGFLIYQEQIMKFLTDFCNHTEAESDTVRRGFAKKTGTEQFLPKIQEGFINTFLEKYKVPINEATEMLQSFLKVIEDASDYGFSLNHSQPYSYIGYACAYLRHYYPKEYLTVMLNVNVGKMDKTSDIMKYANTKHIDIFPIKFRKSKEIYSCNNEGIYKGIASIKYLNNQIARDLFEFGKNQYEDFVDLLIRIKEEIKCDTRQTSILIKLGFFNEFGGSATLLKIYEYFTKKYKKTHIDKTKIKRIAEIKEYALTLENLEFSVRERVEFEMEFLGYVQTKLKDIQDNYYVVTNLNLKYTPILKTYCFTTGQEDTFKIYKNNFREDPVNIGSIIKVYNTQVKERVKPDGQGGWVGIGEPETIITSYSVIQVEEDKLIDKVEEILAIT